MAIVAVLRSKRPHFVEREFLLTAAGWRADQPAGGHGEEEAKALRVVRRIHMIPSLRRCEPGRTRKSNKLRLSLLQNPPEEVVQFGKVVVFWKSHRKREA